MHIITAYAVAYKEFLVQKDQGIVPVI